MILINLEGYMPPALYNQLWLLVKDGHMEYPKVDERKLVEASPNSAIILTATDEQLENLNYKNIFDLAGLTERL